MVTPGGSQPNLQLVAPSPSGLFFCQVQQQTATVRIPSTKLESLGSRSSQPVVGESEPTCIPSSIRSGKGGKQNLEHQLQEGNSDSPGLAFIL